MVGVCICKEKEEERRGGKGTALLEENKPLFPLSFPLPFSHGFWLPPISEAGNQCAAFFQKETTGGGEEGQGRESGGSISVFGKRTCIKRLVLKMESY